MSKLSSDRVNEIAPTLGNHDHDRAGDYPIEKEKGEIEQVEGRDSEKEDAVHTTLIDEALAQSHEESKLGLWKMMKLYYPGLGFGILLSLALVMEGYDLGIVRPNPPFQSRPDRSPRAVDQQFLRSGSVQTTIRADSSRYR